MFPSAIADWHLGGTVLLLFRAVVTVVVPQLAGALEILFGAIFVSQQLLGKAAGMGGVSAVRGNPDSRLEIGQGEFELSLE